ncbi:MAG: hypothetical protein WB996_05455 [Ignavibacteriaceae bacterium]
MILSAITVKKNYLIWFIPLLIISTLILIAKSPVFYQHPDKLSIGITLDFVITLPLVFYFLIRNKNISWIAVSPVATLGIILAGLILPKDHQQLLSHIRLVAYSLMEVLVIAFFITKTSKARKTYNAQKNISFDFYTALKKAVSEVVPQKISNLLSTEIALFYYGFFNWTKRKPAANEFTCHKENGTIAIFSAIIFIIFVETVVQHILIGLLNATVAWIITIVSLYSMLVLIGAARSLSKRPVVITENEFYLRYGILAEAEIRQNNIESVKISPQTVKFNKEIIPLSPLHKLENTNVVIHLREESTLKGFYGKQKKFKSIAFFIDDLARFRKLIGNSIIF